MKESKTLFLTPNESIEQVIKMGIKKGNTSAKKIFILGVLAGMFIGLAYVGYITVTQTLGGFDKGFAKFMGACVFPVGIMLVLFIGGSLFTGNNLMGVAYFDKKVSLGQIAKNWSVVWIGNLVGCFLLAVIAYYGGIFDSLHMKEATIHLAEHKAHMDIVKALFSGFLCNLVVSTAVWMTLCGTDLSGKILASWFPIMLFALSGYQHCVANMFVLSIGKMLAPESFTLTQAFINNLLPVTIGNALSGGVFIPAIYHYLYAKKAVTQTAQA